MQQCCQIHQLSYREFAKIFDISVGHAENIIKHRTYPSLEQAIAIARYFECMVEDMFGWRFDDHGKRSPLIVIDTKTGEAHRVKTTSENPKTLDMVKASIANEG